MVSIQRRNNLRVIGKKQQQKNKKQQKQKEKTKPDLIDHTGFCSHNSCPSIATISRNCTYLLRLLPTSSDCFRITLKMCLSFLPRKKLKSKSSVYKKSCSKVELDAQFY